MFKEKSVKRLNIYNSNHFLLFTFEWDITGNIIEEGIRNDDLFLVKSNNIENNKTTRISSWYRSNFLIRRDSLILVTHKYVASDTLMQFTETLVTHYKKGSVINEQNEIYNQTYASLNKAYKTNYDSSILYLCRNENYREDFSASVGYGQINLNQSSLKQHRFYSIFNKKNFVKYYTEGEDFQKPNKNERSVFCGTVYNDGSYYIETLNENGLFDKRFYKAPGEQDRMIMYAKYEYFKK